MKKLLVVFGVLVLGVTEHASAALVEVDGIWYNLYTNYTTEVSSPIFFEYSVTNIIIPETIIYKGDLYTVTSIGYSAFGRCTSLTSIKLPNSIKSIESRAFQGCTNLTSINIPDGITTIQNNAFLDCVSLTSIEIPISVKDIFASTFKGCTGLTSIEIPNSVKSIYSYTFSGCTSLTSVKLPESLAYIGSDVFENCKALTSVILPWTLKDLGSKVFNGCENLKSIFVENPQPLSSPDISLSAFDYISSTCCLYVPSGSVDIYKATIPWKYIKCINEYEGEVVPVTGIEITECPTGKKGKPLLEVGISATLHWKISPENASNKKVSIRMRPILGDKDIDIDDKDINITGQTAKINVPENAQLGKYIIRVTTENGDYTKECEVEVIRPVEKIIPNPSSKELCLGAWLKKPNYFFLTATAEPEDAYVESGNLYYEIIKGDDIIEIESGPPKQTRLVTAKKAGTATIRIEERYSGVFETVTVKVYEPVTEVKLDVPGWSKLFCFGDVRVINLTVLPESANTKENGVTITWDMPINRHGVDLGKEGVMTKLITAGEKEGSYSVRVVADDKCSTKPRWDEHVGHVTDCSDPPPPEYSPGTPCLVQLKYIDLEGPGTKFSRWESSNPSVIKVEGNGYIRALKESADTVTVTAFADKDFTHKWKICAKRESAYFIPEIMLDPAKLVMPKGTTHPRPLIPNFQIIGEDCPALDRNSSDETVAVVTGSGKVTALKEGTAVITAAAYGLVKGICKVTVTPSNMSVELENCPQSLSVGESVALNAGVIPPNISDYRLEWKTGNDAIAVVDQTGEVTAVAPGRVTITVKAINPNTSDEAAATCTFDVLQRLHAKVFDKNDKPMEGALRIYPIVNDEIGEPTPADGMEYNKDGKLSFALPVGKYLAQTVVSDDAYLPAYYRKSNERPSPAAWQTADTLIIPTENDTLKFFPAGLQPPTVAPGMEMMVIKGNVGYAGSLKSSDRLPDISIILYGKPKTSGAYAPVSLAKADAAGDFIFDGLRTDYNYSVVMDMVGYTQQGNITIQPATGKRGYHVAYTVHTDHRTITAAVTEIPEVTGFETADTPLARLYPNPTDGAFTLVFDTPGIYRITLTDMTGKALLRQTVNDPVNRMDIGNYPGGVYLLVIDDGKRQSVIKIVKKQ